MIGELSLQKGDTVSSEVLHLLVPAGSSEGGRITPRVVIESEEVRTLVISSAVHVLSHLQSVGVNISSGVTDWDLTVSTATNVLSHVTGDSLDVRSRGSGAIIVDNFISGEESESVGVVRERINGCKDVLQVHSIVGSSGTGTVERVLGGVDI